VVADADALINPLAVVVLPIDALVTNEAVARVARSNNPACWTKVKWPEELVQLQERDLARRLYFSWISDSCDSKGQKLEHKEDSQRIDVKLLAVRIDEQVGPY
jgi:hypothetical protein